MKVCIKIFFVNNSVNNIIACIVYFSENFADEDVEHPEIQFRKIANKNMRIQADKMIIRTRGRLIEAKVGDCI